MSAIQERNSTLLDSFRNAFILLIVGLAIIEFGGRFASVGPIVLIFTLILLFVAIYNYWTGSKDLNMLTYIGITMIGVIIWLIIESFRMTNS